LSTASAGAAENTPRARHTAQGK